MQFVIAKILDLKKFIGIYKRLGDKRNVQLKHPYRAFFRKDRNEYQPNSWCDFPFFPASLDF